jgi:hypothetical protein
VVDGQLRAVQLLEWNTWAGAGAQARWDVILGWSPFSDRGTGIILGRDSGVLSSPRQHRCPRRKWTGQQMLADVCLGVVCGEMVRVLVERHIDLVPPAEQSGEGVEVCSTSFVTSLSHVPPLLSLRCSPSSHSRLAPPTPDTPAPTAPFPRSGSTATAPR